MKRLATLLVLSILLVSNVPAGVAIDGGTKDGDQNSGAGPYSFECGYGKLTQEEVQSWINNVWSGFQDRGDVGPGEGESLDKRVEEVMKKSPEDFQKEIAQHIDPHETDTKGNEIGTPTDKKKFDYTSCVDCSLMPFHYGDDVVRMACTKGTPTRVGYCGDDVDGCVKNVSEIYKRDAKGNIINSVRSIINTAQDRIYSKDFKFFEKAGAFGPTTYETLIYANVQKIYDNWLPLATVVSIFVPNPVGIATKVGRRVGSIGTWLRELASGSKEAKTVYALGKTSPFTTVGSRVLSTSKRISNHLFGSTMEVTEGVGAKVTANIDDLGRAVGEWDKLHAELGSSAASYLDSMGMKEKNLPAFRKVWNELRSSLPEKGRGAAKASKQFQEFLEKFQVYNIDEGEKKALLASISRYIKENPKVVDSSGDTLKGLLKTLGLSDGKAVDDVLTLLQEGKTRTATAEIASLLRKAGVQDTASQSAEGIARSIVDAFKESRDIGSVRSLLSTHGIKGDEITEFIAASQKSEAYADVFSRGALDKLNENIGASSYLSEIEHLSAAEQSKLRKLGNIISGTTKTMPSTITRGLVYKMGLLYYMSHSPGQNIGTHQLVFSLPPEAKSKENIKNYLDEEPPYIDILTRQSSYLEGWHHLLSYIHVPRAFEIWWSLMQARFSGLTGKRIGKGEEIEKVELESKCRDDMYRVKDTAWVFQSAKDDERFKIKEGNIIMRIADGGLLLKSEGSLHTYTTEVESKECLPTIIVKTHGLDIKSELWKTDKTGIPGLDDILEKMSGKKTPEKKNTEETGEGLLFKDYINPPIDESRCTWLDADSWTDVLNDAGFSLLAQTIPIVDLITAPFISKNMGECVDTDYWVHMMASADQEGFEILKDLFSGLGEEEEAGETSSTPKESETSETGGGSPSGSTEGSAVSGAVVSGIVLEKTQEGGGQEDTHDTPTGGAVSGSYILENEEEKKRREAEEDEYGLLGGVMSSLEDKLKDIEKATKEYLREQEIKRLNRNTFWFRGDYDEGLYANLRVSKCCYTFFSGKSSHLSTDPDIKKYAAVDPKSNKDVKLDEDKKTGEQRIVVEIRNKDGQVQTLMKKVDDMLRMYAGTVKSGLVIPREAKEITISEYAKSKDILFRATLNEESEDVQIHAGDYGTSKAVTDIVDCILHYINGIMGSYYAPYDYDRALGELGNITMVVLDGGSQIDVGKAAFLLNKPGFVGRGNSLEIRVNRDVVLDGAEVGKVSVLHTEKAQIMWLKDSKGNPTKILVWIYKLGEGKGTKFAIDEEKTRDLEEGVDSDGDGLTDAEEAALGLDPHKVDTDGDGVPDGQEDEDGDGIPNAEEVICNFHGFMLDLGPELTRYVNMIGPVVSFETSDHTVTFIADDSTGTCKKYIRMCERSTGVCGDKEEIERLEVTGNIISVYTTEGHVKLLELGTDEEGKPTLKSIHTDENGNEVEGPETFGPEAVEKIRGMKGVAVYDPNTGRWVFYNGFDIPRDPRFKDGMTQMSSDKGPVTLPGDIFAKPTKESKETASNLFAELPWVPEGEGMVLFVSFLLISALFIQKGKWRNKNGT